MKAWWTARFADIVSAIVYSIIRDHPVRSPHGAPNRTVAFVLAQQARMPSFLVFPLQALTVVFAFLARRAFFSAFLSPTPRQRALRLESWRCSPVPFCRDLLRFFDSLTALGWIDSAEQIEPAETRPNLSAAIHQARDCEVAIVGSGPGGASAAAIWAEAGADVSLFEAGPNSALNSCPPFSSAEMVQKYRHGGLTPAFGNPKIAYVEGRCVGGGSEINSGLYHRTPAEVLERWAAEFALEQSSVAEMQPHFEACERDLSVSFLQEPAPLASLKLAQGAAALGWSSQEVPRWFRSDPSGGPGIRQSMT
ncbi:MAG TPA: GMC family oxidoreductase N-terminal domain-containing protein, partial [Chthoniobacteraceae bacterium]